MSSTTVSPVLPYIARVEVYDDGQWVPEAQGSSVAWLREEYAEALAVHGLVRLVSVFGEELDAAALGVVDVETADAAIGAATSSVGAIDAMTSALAAGVPIADLLAAQAQRHGGVR